MTDINLKRTPSQLVPFFVAITILYSFVYHIMMYRAILDENVTQDECAEHLHSGGIVPPQCLELQVFRDWDKKVAEEEMLMPTPVSNEPLEVAATAETKTSLLHHKAAIVVDVFGETSAGRISDDFAELEKTFSQLVVVNEKGRVDVKPKESLVHKEEVAPQGKSSVITSVMAPWGTSGALETLQEHVQHEFQAGMKTFQEPIHSDDAHKDFATLHAEIEARHKARAEHRLSLVRDIAHRMDKLDENLKDMVSDRKAWESTLLEKYDENNITADHLGVSPPAAAFMSKQLKWSAIPTVYHNKRKVSHFLDASRKQPIVVSKGDVRHLHWKGKIPKVAAITWIRGDRKTKARMMYFVDNFKLQDYDGPRELLLVYHAKDTHAADLVRHYATNGTNVKAVAAHDFSQDMFPSDPALRYAAWASDADVIAQWDFDEWHDPSRLSMQVRAMAHTGRHACVLSTLSTSHSQADEDKEISLVSLVGERSWMKEHWHPFSKRVSEVSETFKVGGLVELDMQNKAMMGNISRIEHVFVETTTKRTTPISQAEKSPAIAESGKAEGTDFSRGITECLDYDTVGAKGHESEAAAEKAITENVGPEFGRKFHKLVKRRSDVIMKLQLLCFQTTMEHDKAKWKFMHEHVLEMAGVRAELDKHITNTASLFGSV